MSSMGLVIVKTEAVSAAFMRDFYIVYIRNWHHNILILRYSDEHAAIRKIRLKVVATNQLAMSL